MSELKNCPFCGKDASAHRQSPNNYTAYCTDTIFCGANMQWFESEEKAIAAWNRRAVVQCKDCKYYREEVCCNDQSDWRADYPPEDGSCEHCEAK